MLHNPVDGVKRPCIDSQEEKTLALGDHQARALLNAPDLGTLQGLRGCAIPPPLCALKVGSVQQRRGVMHLEVRSKVDNLRYVPLRPGTAELIDAHRQQAGYGEHRQDPLFRPMRDSGSAEHRTGITPDGVYMMLMKHAASAKIDIDGFGQHALRATAATNAPYHDADIAEVQQRLGHANISATRIYDRRSARPKDSPTFKVAY